MSTKFLEGVSGKLAAKWVAILLTPAFIFWMGGLGAYIWRFGWRNLEVWYRSHTEVLQISLLALGVLLVTGSAIVVQRFDSLLLRFLEGYWPRWMRRLRYRLVRRNVSYLHKLEQKFQILSSQIYEGKSLDTVDEFLILDAQLRRIPVQSSKVMPTKVGNILRASENRTFDKYGLDAAICWSRLWLLLPSDVKEEVAAYRFSLNSSVRLLFWSLLFLIWVKWAWWTLLLGLVSACLAYHWILEAAAIYGDLIEAVFDLYRFSLYSSLRWPLPSTPAEERNAGLKLTEYLWRGSDERYPSFTRTSAQKE